MNNVLVLKNCQKSDFKNLKEQLDYLDNLTEPEEINIEDSVFLRL